MTRDAITAKVNYKSLEMKVMKEKKEKKVMTTIWVERDLVEELKQLGTMGDNYSTVIRRLLNGNKGDVYDNRGVTRDEPVGDRH